MSDHNQSTLGEAIAKMLKVYRLEDKVTETDIWQSWKSIMGSSIYKHTQKVELRGRVLLIRLDSSVLRQELGFAKAKIVDNINDHIGKRVIDDILLM